MWFVFFAHFLFSVSASLGRPGSEFLLLPPSTAIYFHWQALETYCKIYIYILTSIFVKGNNRRTCSRNLFHIFNILACRLSELYDNTDEWISKNKVKGKAVAMFTGIWWTLCDYHLRMSIRIVTIDIDGFIFSSCMCGPFSHLRLLSEALGNLLDIQFYCQVLTVRSAVAALC